jgi:ribosome recycling factor
MINSIIERIKAKMARSVDFFRDELKAIRTGRASVSLFDNIKVDYYGTHTPLSHLATLHTPDPHTISVQPWDPSVIKDIEKAILSSNLGFNPANDGKIIRIPVPPLTEERRKDLVKLVKKFGEDTKIAIRNIRRDAIEEIKKLLKTNTISEDESKDAEKEIQNLTDRFIALVEKHLAAKEKDMMAV